MTLRINPDRTIKDVVDKLMNYWDTYPNQPHYEHYTPTIILDDALYAIGIAFHDKYKFADGYRHFLADLSDHIDNVLADGL